MEQQLKEFFNKQRAVIIPVAISLSSLVVLGLVIVPQVLSYFTVQDEILQTKDKIARLEVKAQELESIDPNLSEAKLRVVSTILPPDPDVPLAVDVLQGVVRRSGLLLEGIDYLPSTQENNKSFQLSVRVSGTLQNIRAFILGLKDAPRVFAIETIQLRSPGAGRIEAEIPISVFYGEYRAKGLTEEGVVPVLTGEEQALLQRLEKLVPLLQAGVITEASPSSSAITVPIGKNDPFE